MIKELFFSLVSERLFITLLGDNKVIKTICENNHRRHSENFVLKVKEVFNNAPFSVGDLNRIFFLTGPGGQTGERVSFSFVLASLLSNPLLEAFSMDSLTFQAMAFKECLSIISTGERSKQYHLIAYQNGRVLLRKEKIAEEELLKVKEMFVNLPVVANFTETNFLTNFFLSKGEFKAFTSKLI